MTNLLLLFMQSPLTNLAQMIATHLAEIWDFLIFLGQVSGFVVVLSGAILWFTEVNIKRGRSLVFGGILLSVIIEYFVLFPPGFTLS